MDSTIKMKTIWLFVSYSYLWISVIQTANTVDPKSRGDKIEGDAHKVKSRNVVGNAWRWKTTYGGCLYYEFNSTATYTEPQKQTIKDALNKITYQTNGCIKFKERTSESTYVSFRDEGGYANHNILDQILTQQVNI